MTSYLLNLMAVLLGGAIGGACRYFVAGLVTARFGASFPWGTLLVNVSGALLVGILVAFAGSAESGMADPQLQWLLIGGFCGSFTTVSSFALQTLEMGRQQPLRAAANVIGSLGLCLIGVWVGRLAGRVLLGGA